MAYCCVPFCKSDSRKVKNISFHEFPSNYDLRFAWLRAISRKDFFPNENSNSSRVCSKHFKDEDYVPNLKRRRLKPNSVPSVFEGYPSYKIPNEVNFRRILKRSFGESSSNVSKKCNLQVTPNTDLGAAKALNFSDTLQNTSTELSDQCIEATNDFRNEESYMEIEMSSASNLKDQYSQTKTDMQSIAKLYIENRRLQKLIYSRNKEIASLKKKLNVANQAKLL